MGQLKYICVSLLIILQLFRVFKLILVFTAFSNFLSNDLLSSSLSSSLSIFVTQTKKNYFYFYFISLSFRSVCKLQHKKNSIHQLQLIRSNSALCIIKLHSAMAAELQSVYSKSPMFFLRMYAEYSTLWLSCWNNARDVLNILKLHSKT